jgi:hypothetical protein
MRFIGLADSRRCLPYSELLDIKRDLDGLFDVAGFGTSLRRFGDAGRAIEAFAYFGDMDLQRCFEHVRIHGGSFATTHALLCLEVERKDEQSYGSFAAIWIILRLINRPKWACWRPITLA